MVTLLQCLRGLEVGQTVGLNLIATHKYALLCALCIVALLHCALLFCACHCQVYASPYALCQALQVSSQCMRKCIMHSSSVLCILPSAVCILRCACTLCIVHCASCIVSSIVHRASCIAHRVFGFVICSCSCCVIMYSRGLLSTLNLQMWSPKP